MQRGLDVPTDLLDVWLTFGGGMMFEFEEILAPVGVRDYAADFDEANRTHRARGLPEGLFVFDEGTWLSVVRRISPRYVTVGPDTYITTGEFDSLDEWYQGTVREEFAERYGLRNLP